MKARTAAVVASVALAGCATVTRGTNETLVIESDPSGAAASLSNGMRCTTPCGVKVKRRGDIVVTIEKEGYEPVQAIVVSDVDAVGVAAASLPSVGVGALVGNMIVGVGGIGPLVDARTGAMRSHMPNPLVVKLKSIPEDE